VVANGLGNGGRKWFRQWALLMVKAMLVANNLGNAGRKWSRQWALLMV